MSRAMGRFRAWGVRALLAGALTPLVAGQGSAQPPAPGGAPPAAAKPAKPAEPAKDRAWARGQLMQARGQLSQGNFDSAEALANEVAKVNLTYTAVEDTPAKVLKDARAARGDAKALLQAARHALARKDYDLAEKHAQMASKQAGLMTFPAWGDTPSKALKDIAAARRIAPAATAKAPAASPEAGDKSARAKALLKQARAELASGQHDAARQSCAQARALNANLGWWDDNPDKVEADIRRAAPTRSQPAPAAVTAKAPAKPAAPAKSVVVPKTKDEARAQLAVARQHLASGQYDDAIHVAQAVKGASGISWGLFDDTPDRLVADVRKARAKRDRDMSAQVLADARRAYEKGDYEGATKMAHRAQQMHGEYNVWDLGDRPSKLLSDIQSAQARARKTDLPGGRGTTALASNSKPSSPSKLQAQQTVAEAVRLVEESKALGDDAAQAKLVAARQKADDAQKMGASYGSDEVSPSAVVQMVAMEGKSRVDRCLRQCDDAMTRGDRAAGERHLSCARAMALAMGMDAKPMDVRLAEMRGGAPPPPPPPGVALASHQAPPPGAQGQTLLEKARQELNKGEVSTARRLAEEAMRTPGMQDEAMAVLRSVDTEELNQKKLAANKAFDAAMAAYRRKEYGQAQAMISALDTRLLDAERMGRLREVNLTPEMAPSRTRPTAVAQAPVGTGVVPASGTGQAPALAATTPGRATASDMGEDRTLDEYKQRQKVLAEMLRKKGLDVQADAAEKARRGQYQAAMDALQDFLTELGEQKLDPVEVKRLGRPVEARLSQFRVMAAQKEIADGRMAQSSAAAERVVKSRQAEDVRRKNLDKLMRDFNTLYKEGKYLEAESTAMKAVELDPDSGIATAAVSLARRQRAVLEYRDIKEERQAMTLQGLNDAETVGTAVPIKSGIAYDQDRWNRAKGRQPLSPIKLGRPSEAEKEIERQLTMPVSISFEKVPLSDALEELRRINNINIDIDRQALQQQGIDPHAEISIKLDRVSLKSALNLMLHKVGLTYVIRDEVLFVTTEENARGKLKTVTYQVADLVIPVHDFGDVRNPTWGNLQTAGGTTFSGAAPTPVTGPGSMVAGQPVGSPTGTSMLPGMTSPGTAMASAGNGAVVNKGRAANTTEEQLMRLITNTVGPRTWSEMGGPGTIEYHPMTMALVINQTPDIQEQVQDLLAALRRLQDQEVAIEIRFISVSEDFFERVGVNFNLNILTDTARHEPALLGNSFVTDAGRFINTFDPKRFIAGLTPAGTLTPTLDIPITNQTFFQTVPNFGGYVPGAGLSMGLAFLSDIQVFLFLEAVQGDLRANVMQAPKLTLFNGQTSTLTVNDTQSFVSGIQVSQLAGGQFAILPQNNPQFFGTFLTVQAVISADRRFVRLSLSPQLTNLVPGPNTVPTFPIVVPIFTSLLDQGSGQPVVLTQFLQQPVISSVSVQTTVAVPDGGTVLLGGLKRLSEARSEYGPPILSKLPYVNRLFKNVGYGRETDSLLIMVTPRIIIQEEEQERATGFVETPAIRP